MNKDTHPAVVAWTCLGVALGVPALLVVGTMIDGLLLVTLWRWFIVTTFGLTALTTAQALGVALVVRVLRPNQYIGDLAKNPDAKWYSGLLVGLVLTPGFALLAGYIVKSFLP